MIKGRWYQNDAVEAIWNYFRTKFGNPIVAMPTGTGKSIVIALFLMSIYKLFFNQKILVITHVQELIEQNHAKLLAAWPQAPAGIYSAGVGRKDTMQKIIFAGIQSIVKSIHLFGHVDLIIIDECHLVSPNDKTMYMKVISFLKKVNPNLKVIGLTATKYRMGQGELIEEGGLFTDVCYDITDLENFNKLIAEGFIIPLVSRPTQAVINITGIGIQKGELVEKQLVESMKRDHITERAIKECLAYCNTRKRWLVFATGIEHAKEIGQMLDMEGITNRVVYSGMPKKGPGSREEALHLHKTGQIQALINNNILTTGYDDPEIDLIVVLRATMSTGLWVQMLGRGTRPCYADGFDLETVIGRLCAIQASDKQDCLVLDFARNARRLGPINDPVIPKKPGKGGGMAPIKVCEKCGCENHPSVRFCTARPEEPKNAPACGHPFTFEVKFKGNSADDAIVRADVPIVEVFNVNHVTYAIHTKADKPPMLKVTYYCGLTKTFTDYVCIEHEGFAARKARAWMKERLDGNMMSTTKEALEFCTMFKVPTQLRVWTNKQYPEIMAYCFDGTAFNTLETPTEAPTVDANRAVSPYAKPYDPLQINPDLGEIEKLDSRALLGDFCDDDIPF